MRAGRFPDTIIRRRESPGERSDAGEYIHGAVSQTTFKASVQPVNLEDVDAPEGARLLHRLKVYISEPNALAAAFDDAVADKVVYENMNYVVEESFNWPDHTKAIIMRQN